MEKKCKYGISGVHTFHIRGGKAHCVNCGQTEDLNKSWAKFGDYSGKRVL